MRQRGNPCLGCGCNMGGTITYSYCTLCENNKCAKCGVIGIKSDLCIGCRVNR